METSLQENPKYDILYQENEDFRELCDEHMELKREASELSKSKWLAEEDNNRLHEIKIRKLEIKDLIEAMINDG
jgi:uncharacterized protein YdcH (DUF465 family)